MGVKCSEIISFMEAFAPLNLAAEWDNSGLAVGSKKAEINKIMLCLDVTSQVVDEAINKKADLLISHHPFIFKAMKSLNSDNYKGALVAKLIKNDISVYCAHTNLDAAQEGVNARLAQLLGLKDIKCLDSFKQDKVYKIVVYGPEKNMEEIKDVMFEAGAGWIGNYSECSFMGSGRGTFKPLEGTNPYIGTHGKQEKVYEYRLETVVPQENLKKVIEAIHKVHPYEEPAIDIFELELEGRKYSYDRVGMIEEPVELEQFIKTVKEKLCVPNVRVIGSLNKKVQKVLVGSGAFSANLNMLEREKIDVLVTGDIKYHDASDIAERGLCAIDAGHFGTERIVLPVLEEKLKQKFRILEIFCNTVETDPFIFS